MPIPLKPFYMIRHGESEANRDGYFSGGMDVLLTETGRHQAKQTQDVFDKLKVKPTNIIHSHLVRAKETATIINETLGLPIHEVPHLGEQQFGEWEYKAWTDIRPLFENGDDPPNGEPYSDFKARITQGFQTALSFEGMPLIVSHGGVFRGFHALYSQKGKSVENAKLYHFEPDESLSDFPWNITLIE